MKKLLPFIYLLGIVVIALLFSQFQADIPVDELKTKYANAESKFMNLDSMQVHYRIEGNGAPLVLIHGTSSSLHTWDGWTNNLKKDFTVIRMDIPAFGLTGPNQNNDYSMKNYVKFLHSFLQKLNLDTFYLAGNSLGGWIAWEYALQYPQQVKKLILIDAAGYPKDKIPQLFRLAKMPVVKDLFKVFTPKFMIEKNIKEVYFDETKITDDLVQQYFDMALRKGNRDAFLARVNAGFVGNYAALPNLKVPTLIQWGKHDKWVPLKEAERFKQDIKGSKLIIYQNAAHIPMEEIPEETAKDAAAFLNGL